MPATRTALVVAAVFAAASVASGQSDNFNDGVIGPAWTLLQDNPAQLSLTEAGGVLGVTSVGSGGRSDDALYLSNGPAGFRLSTADPFSLQLDYTFGATDNNATAGDLLAVVFGIGRDLAGTDSAAVGFGAANSGASFTATTVAYRIDNVETVIAAPSLTTGSTFTIAYNPTGDVLTLTGAGLSQPLPGLVQGAWNADAVFVSFGARGTGFTTTPATTFLDNFTLITGTVVPVPEPAALSLLASGALLLRRGVRGRAATA